MRKKAKFDRMFHLWHIATMATFEYYDGFPDHEKSFSNLTAIVSGIPSGCRAFSVDQVGDRFIVKHKSPSFEVAFDFPGWNPIYVDGRPVPDDVPVHAVIYWLRERNCDFVRLRMDAKDNPGFWLEVSFTRCRSPTPE